MGIVTNFVVDTRVGQNPSGARRSNGHPVELDRALAFIDAFLSDPIEMPELASHAGVTIRSLQRLFRRSLRTTPSAYIRARRLDNARRELTDPLYAHETIATIGVLNGFSHLGRFAAAYHAQYGERPSETRRRLRCPSVLFNPQPDADAVDPCSHAALPVSPSSDALGHHRASDHVLSLNG